MTSNVPFRELQRYLKRIGFKKSTEERDHFRFEHPSSGSVLVLRSYLPGETVSELDLKEVGKLAVERGAVDEDSFEEFLRQSLSNGQDELPRLYRIFFAGFELAESILEHRVTFAPPWLPYTPEFHFQSALASLVDYLEWTGGSLESWKRKLASKFPSAPVKSILQKTANAIYPLLREQPASRETKGAALDRLREAVMELGKEIDKQEKAKGAHSDLSSDAKKLSPSVAKVR
jgi:hypothetical protein